MYTLLTGVVRTMHNKTLILFAYLLLALVTTACPRETKNMIGKPALVTTACPRETKNMIGKPAEDAVKYVEPLADRFKGYKGSVAKEEVDKLVACLGEVLGKKEQINEYARIFLAMEKAKGDKGAEQVGLTELKAKKLCTSDGFIPLHEAIKKIKAYPAKASAYQRILKLLIAVGADVNATDDSKETPLHLAAEVGQVAVVNALIAAEADVNATNNHKETPLHLAALHGQVAVVNALIAAEADVNATDDSKETPLHTAALCGQLAVVNALIAAEADVNATNNYRETPLHLAAKWGRLEVMRALIAAKADVNAKNNYRETPLQIVKNRHRSDIIEILKAGVKK